MVCEDNYLVMFSFATQESQLAMPDSSSNVVYGCQISLLILVLIGVVGNVLSLVVMCGASLRLQPTSVCLQALAAADILVLLTCVFR